MGSVHGSSSPCSFPLTLPAAAWALQGLTGSLRSRAQSCCSSSSRPALASGLAGLFLTLCHPVTPRWCSALSYVPRGAAILAAGLGCALRWGLWSRLESAESGTGLPCSPPAPGHLRPVQLLKKEEVSVLGCHMGVSCCPGQVEEVLNVTFGRLQISCRGPQVVGWRGGGEHITANSLCKYAHKYAKFVLVLISHPSCAPKLLTPVKLPLRPLAFTGHHSPQHLAWLLGLDHPTDCTVRWSDLFPCSQPCHRWHCIFLSSFPRDLCWFLITKLFLCKRSH